MKRIRKIVCMFAVLIALSLQLVASACTPMAVGKDATADGSTMVSHTCDGWYDHRIQVVKGGTHSPGETVDIYRDPCMDTMETPELVGTVPQVEKTYTYFNVAYPFMNEKSVMVGEHTWGGRDDVYSSEGLFVIANLEMLGLQRSATAREMVQVMGALAEQYGYCDGGECLAIADPNEVWIFEVCGPSMMWTPDSGRPGAHWAARRLADDEAWVGANRSRLGVIDFDDPDNFMWSTDITKLPEEMGWWKQGEEFNFSEVFDPQLGGTPFICSRREWRAFSLMAPSQELPLYDRREAYPFSIKPDEKLSVQDLMDIYSDHYEGTEYDLTQGLDAGPFGSPVRWRLKSDQKPADMAEEGHDWERAIAIYRCSYSFVAQARSWMPESVGGVLWFGEDDPSTTVYVPVYCSVTEVPEAWSTGNRKDFDPDCAWWAFNFVNNWATLRWDAIYEEVRAKKASYEDVFFANQEATEAKAMELYEKDPAAAAQFLTEYTNKAMNDVEEGWWDFAWHLVGKYADGNSIQEDGSNTNLGYPSMDWLEGVNYGGTSKRDFDANTERLEGTADVEPSAQPSEAPSAAPSAAPAPSSAPTEPAESGNTAVIAVVIIAILVVAVAAYFIVKKKNEKK